MRGLTPRPKSYFTKYKNIPVEIKPFDPKSLEIYEKYKVRLFPILFKFNLTPFLRGSTLFQISGKGDIECGLSPSDDIWEKLKEVLNKFYKICIADDEEIMIFYEMFEGYDFEIIVMRGHTLKVDTKLHKYLLARKDLLDKYEEMKKKHAFSKRVYQYQKELFFRKVIKSMP